MKSLMKRENNEELIEKRRVNEKFFETRKPNEELVDKRRLRKSCETSLIICIW